MPASKNSANSRRSKNSRPHSAAAPAEFFTTMALLAVIAAVAVCFVQIRQHALYYGDAVAHLNIARRLVDGQTLGYHQIGTVWLPLPHLLFAPLVKFDYYWQTGLAGALPSAFCWVLAGCFLYLLLRRAFSRAAAMIGLGVFVGNLNLLYLAATPMTETIFFASALGMLYFSVSSVSAGSLLAVSLAALCSVAACMTRYEGWFLLPFVTLYLLFFGGQKRWQISVLFALLASVGPLYWLAHNWIFYSDPLEFFRGPDSAHAIYQRYLDKGMARYPGDQNWPAALRQFSFATKAVNGWPLLLIAAAGVVPTLKNKVVWPLLFLSLSPIFYVMILHSGGTPIFIPEIYPFSHYNTRYALAALPLFAVLTAGLANALGSALPSARWLLAPIAASWFLFSPVLTWRESEVNSISRRAWTSEVAQLLKEQYRPGEGILMPFGDLTAALTEAGIPIRECLHQGDLVYYESAVGRPDLFLQAKWAVVISGEPAGNAMARAVASGMKFQLLKRISLKDAPVVEVWRR